MQRPFRSPLTTTLRCALVVATLSASVGLGAGRADASIDRATRRLHPTGALGVQRTLVRRAPFRMAATLPSAVDLSPDAPPVRDQGNLQSCVGWAVAYGLFGWYANHLGLGSGPFAPMYVYTQLNGGQNVPTSPQAAMSIAVNGGIDVIADYPSDWSATLDYQTAPSAAQRANATHWTANSYSVVTTAAGLQSALASGAPAVVMLPIRPGFDALSSTAYVDDDAAGTARGYHVMLAVGYNSTGVWVQNSWGRSWGANGYGLITWNVINQDLVQAFTISGMTATSTDTTPPVVQSPAATPRLGSTTGTNGAVEFDITWRSADASGIAATNLYSRTDSGSWTPVALARSNATSARMILVPGHTVQFAVRAQDTAGNWSDYQYSRQMRIVAAAETSPMVRYSTGWRSAAWASALGGQLAVTATASATATFSFTGDSVAWIASKATNRGRAVVYIDGVRQGTWDLYSASTVARAAVLTWRGTYGSHTLRVVNQATTGRPSIDVDGFVTLA